MMREIIRGGTPPPPKRKGPAPPATGHRASSHKRHNAASDSATEIPAQQRTGNFPDALADARLARQVEQLWRLGLRPIFQLLVELGAERMIRMPIETKVTRFIERLSPAMLAAA